MSSTKEEFFKVPKLLADGSNWVTYRDRLRWALNARGLLGQIDQENPEPTNPTVNAPLPDPSDTAAVTAAASLSRGYEIRIEKWQMAEATVKQCIASSVPDSIFNRIKTKKTAKDVWDAVSQIFEDRSTMVAIDLRLKLQSVKCGDTEDVRAHFDKLADMKERLASYGVTLDDHEYASILVGSLPSTYDPTLSSILASAKLSKTTLDPDIVTSLIIDDFDRREVSKKKSKKDDKDVAYYAGGSSEKGKDGKSDKECHNCGKKGHFKADCWAKGGGKEGQGPKAKKGKASGGKKEEKVEVNVATVSPEEEKVEGVWAVECDEEMNDWKSDSGDDTDWSILSKSDGDDDMDDSPASLGTPGTGLSNEELLSMLTHDIRHTFLNGPLDESVHPDHSSMPDLQSVSDSSCDSTSDGMPDFRLVASENDDENEAAIWEDQDDLPVSSEIPDLDQANADRLRYIWLSRQTDSASFAEAVSEHSSMPGLQSVSTSSAGSCVSFDDESSEDDLDSCSELEDILCAEGAETTTFAGATLAGTLETRKTESELYDSGASRHMTPFKHRLLNYTEIDSRPITAADKRVFHAIGKGDLRIQVPNGNTTTTILLRDVLYAPDMGLTIISVSRIAAAGYATLFRADFCRIFDNKNKRIGHVYVTSNGLYRVDHGEVVSSVSAKHSISLMDLHRRMGHIAPAAIRKLVKTGGVVGVVLEDEEEVPCDSCEYAKATRKRIRKEREEPRASNFGDEIHSDVWGPATTLTIHHRKYYASFTDDSTRYSHVALLSSKDETFSAYKDFEAWANTQHGATIKQLRSDRGGEYIDHDFRDHLLARGTERRLTTHDTPEHNGIAESLNRRLLERVRAMLHHSGLPKFLWGEALMHGVWLKNRTLTRALDHNMTPYEALTGKKPDLSNLHEWGTKVWVHDPNNSKLDARSKVGCWVGFDNESTHGHRIYWPDRRTVSVERDVKFDDSYVMIPSADDVPLEGEISDNNRPVVKEENLPSTSPAPSRSPSPTPPPRSPSPEEPRRSGRIRDDPEYKNGRINYRDTGHKNYKVAALEDEEDVELGGAEFAMGAATMGAEGLDPRTVEEAQGRSDWPMWEEAMKKELDSLRAAKTWDVVERPAGKNIVGCKWVFRIKKDADGRIEKYKARLVARGFTQVYGVDYTETFAPVAKMASLRTILAIATRNNWPIEVFDFNSAFLNGELDEEIYMQLPPGFEGYDLRKFVARLRKALYGLKQGGRTWYKALWRALEELGFKRAEYDHGVFFAKSAAGIVVLAIHVDDCTITGTTRKLLDDYKVRINARYAMTDLGPISWLLGIQVTRNMQNRTITLSQRSYIESIIARFNFTDAKPLAIPMDPNVAFSKDDCPKTEDEIAKMRRIPYREAIGSLMYASVGTRPDIAFAVSTLSQFLDNPGPVHWEAVKRIFRYLVGTKDWGLTLGGGKEGLEGFTDADGASQEHRRAISGYAFIMDGGAISWSSRKQELVTLSTTEAEYVAATHAAREAIWLRHFIGEVFSPLTDPTTLHCDNQSAVAIATNGNFHARTKHIDIRYHFIRYVVEDKSIRLIYCPTDDMTADTFTKALPSAKAKHFAAALGLRPTSV